LQSSNPDRELAARLLQRLELLASLDAFRDDREVKYPGKFDDGADDLHRLGAVGDAADE